MSTQFKLLLRSLTSFVMIFSGALILLWFVVVVISSILGFKSSSGDVMEVMLFLLFMGIAVIAIAAMINISLSIDLIAEAKIKELHQAKPNEKSAKGYLKWGLIVLGTLVLATWVADYYLQKRRMDDFRSLTAEVAESHQGNLERIFDYLEDTSQILKIKEVLETVNSSSDQVSWTEAIVLKEVLGKENILAFSAGTDSATLISQSFENLIVVPPTEEKELLNELFYAEKSGPQVILSENNEFWGYSPISKGGKVLVIRVKPKKEFNGSRR